MAKKRPNAEARLRIRIEALKRVGPWWRSKVRPFVAPGLSGRKLDDLSDPDVWSSMAREALKLRDTDRALKRAFTTLNLDPSDPRDWRELVELLAAAFFIERKKAGRHKQWTSERKLELLGAVDAKQRRNLKLSDKQACKQLAQAKDSPPYFQKAGTEGLLRQLRFARAETDRRSARRSRTST